ncbi:M48 family metalloprotease [Thauera linaloolentis]|uniref:Peptidase M48 Ste24p n=1 Tax=Thauera linaloolentis (strain DSM 12138 / JCM 21573 / CCUG 41526 / CIP 105981 / IAM 15112 / NBRC 102519 / 47Lol) TaxID=1123367 RepID=N6XQL5_THAL4|nr:M48 family metalloprotease [Thauera linaloolentis]ENO83961.1 peptidase M48 Ste24p [Thauera linaloolentis 47Lol = DSM 12138]MCM8567547.1 M48 family metalloprotease [Thauera linaloolentis]
MMRRPLALLLSLALAFPVHAYDLPDLGDVAASELSPAAERRIGEQIISQIRWRDASYLDDPEVEEYINRVGHRLAAVSNNPGLEFDFFVVSDATLNAFALPGGYIGVHTGLLLAAQTESEFASVLGHEIAHVTQRHIAQIVGKQSQSAMLMMASLLVAVLAARSNSDVSQAAIAAGQAGAIQSQLGYTRAFEREADRVGLETLESAGFDVRGMPGFFERLQRATRMYENNAPAYLRTHPLTTERIADMENRVGSMHYRQVADSPDFLFSRAKLRANAGLAADAVRDMESQVAQTPNELATSYGLARALFRAGRLDEASARLDAVRAKAPPSPWVETLRAEIALARKDGAGAVRTLEAAARGFPSSRSLVYALANARILGGQPQEAVEGLRRALDGRQSDPRLWQLLSRAYAELGKLTAQHRAQAEVYLLRGSLPAAIEQLEIASKAGDGDFYDMSAVDARLRVLKQRIIEQKRDRDD